MPSSVLFFICNRLNGGSSAQSQSEWNSPVGGISQVAGMWFGIQVYFGLSLSAHWSNHPSAQASESVVRTRRSSASVSSERPRIGEVPWLVVCFVYSPTRYRFSLLSVWRSACGSMVLVQECSFICRRGRSSCRFRVRQFVFRFRSQEPCRWFAHPPACSVSICSSLVARLVPPRPPAR